MLAQMRATKLSRGGEGLAGKKGSAAAATGIKQFKQRLTGAGMRWSRPAAERRLTLRAAALRGPFDALGDAA